MAFLNQFWALNVWLGTNGPFWSIAYEFWYYVIFGAAFYFGGLRRGLITIAAMTVAGPKIVVALPIWLLGVALYRWRPTTVRPFHVPLGALMWAASFSALWAFCAFDVSKQLEREFPALLSLSRQSWEVDFFPSSFMLGAILAINLYGFMLLSNTARRPPAVFKRLVGLLSEASFGLYLFHYPIGYFVKAALWSQGITTGPVFIATVYGISFAAAFALGLACDPLRKPIRRLLDRRWPAPTATAAQ
jgi:peptidoglycan/LPS O-acetylase OafA/YrhL